MTSTEFAYLFNSYFDKTASTKERREFMHHLTILKSDAEIVALLETAYQQNTETLEFPEHVKTEILHRIFHAEQEIPIQAGHPKIVRFYQPWMKYVAALILSVGSIGWYLSSQEHPNPRLATLAKDIPPGGNKATLTLGNGKKVILNDAAVGLLAKQGNMEITKTEGGQIVYSPKSENGNTSVINTIETQNGGQYQINLPDGTKVWLNAASSLKYPTSFSTAERKVILKGEAYFEVAHHNKQPFKVILDHGAEIKVLGTHFNIKAYVDGSSIDATLLEGSIIMKSGIQEEEIKPGQQAQLFSSQRINVLKDVNIEQVTAWKKGYFSIGTIELHELMKQIEKWYDMKIIYKDVVHAEFVAKIPRNLPLSELLELLEYTKQIHFKQEGRTLYVMK